MCVFNILYSRSIFVQYYVCKLYRTVGYKINIYTVYKLILTRNWATNILAGPQHCLPPH